MPWWSSGSGEAPQAADRRVVQRLVEASRRAEVVALVNSARTEREVARVTADELCEALEAEIAVVVVTRPHRGERETIAWTGLSSEQAVAASADRLVTAALGSPLPEVHAGEDLLGVGARQLVLSPWTADSGRQVVIGVGRCYDQPYNPAEVALLQAVTPSVGHGLERSWLWEERDRHAGRQSALARAAKSVSSTLDGRTVLHNLCPEVKRALEADAVGVFAAGKGGELVAVAGTGLPQGAACPLEPVVRDVLRDGRPRSLQPFAEDPAMAGAKGSRTRMRSGLVAPIRPQDRVDGAVVVGFRGDRWIEREDVELLVAFADLAAVACRNAADHEAARRAAALDSLTGCLNHGAFRDRLNEEIDRAGRTGGSLALALLDLNGFKAVNDTLGHLRGDAVLREVAHALGRAVRSYDQVARYGGDEFALLLPSTDEETARAITDRALVALAALQLPERPAVSASAGLAFWRPGDDANGVIERADQRLLEAKRARRRAGTGEAEGPADAERDRDRLRRLATVGALGPRLARLHDQRLIVSTAGVELVAALGYEQCMLVRRERDGRLAVTAAADDRMSIDASGAPVPPAVPDAVRRCVAERRAVREAGPEAADLAVPVFVGGRLWGAVGVRASTADFDEDDAQLVQRVADHLGAALRTAELYDELEQAHLGTAAALAAALEAKDAYTADHADAVADLAVEVGRELGLGDAALREVRYGAIFHDIGKIAIPDVVLNKPGPLTAAELDLVRRHPVVGEEILAPVPFLAGVRRIVRHDHERWDGRGYPDGLRGEAIPLGARIVLVVDAYHAMRTDRPYRPAMTEAEARAELSRNAGSQFDPRVTRALLAVLWRRPATMA